MKVSTHPEGEFDLYVIRSQRGLSVISFNHIRKALATEDAYALVMTPHASMQNYTLNSENVLVAYRTGKIPVKRVWAKYGFAIKQIAMNTRVQLNDYGTWTPGTVAANTFQ